MELLCFGLSHKTAAVDFREQYAFGEGELPSALERICADPEIAEALILSTCNRVELYLCAEDAVRAREAAEKFLGDRRAWQAAEAKAFYFHQFPNSARHLFEVVCGLDSMVVGETEILGQVKRAYASASGEGRTARYLNRLFQRAFRVAKQVRSRTSITRGAVSVGSVAVDLAEKIFGKLDDCQVMILGAGETGERTARSLVSRGAAAILVSNRSRERAENLARELGGKALSFETWEESLHEVDILISSTAAPHTVVHAARLREVMEHRPDRPLFVVDIAVPRDVDAEVNDLEGVYLYDIDALQAIADQTLELRKREIQACRRIIHDHVEDFGGWLSLQKAGGVSAPIKRREIRI